MSEVAEQLKAALASRYALKRELGSGGMATVFLAEDLRHHRPVAIKVLSTELGAHLGAPRFLREIEIAARLAHPHILPVHDSGSAEGLLYYVMPFVEGESLRERLDRQKQLPLSEALGITREVADALDYAHRQGVVHRDIKPENILLEEGHAVVADFGIARAIDAAGDATLTSSSLVIGTPLYMSPEQSTGSVLGDGRNDQYSLACVLYEMLAGEPPFTGPTVQAIRARHMFDPVPPLRTVRPGLPEGVERAVTRALAKTAADRFSTASEFAEATGMIEEPAAPSGASIDRRRPSHSPRWLIATAVAGLLAVTTALLILLPGLKGLRERFMGEAPAGRSMALAVLPLENLSADPDQEYFADGLTEELIGNLTKIRALRVIARTSVMRFNPNKGMLPPLPVIARQLRVEAVVQGSVRRFGTRIRISVQLTDAATERNLWAETYERDEKDVLLLQSDVARAIAHEIQINVAPEEEARLASTRSVDPDAHEAYLKGRYHWNKRTTEGATKGIAYFEQAIEKDPSYAQAYVGLADCYHTLGTVLVGAGPPGPRLARAKMAAMKALELDDNLAEAHASLAYARLNEWEWPAAEAGFKEAIRLNPSFARAHIWYSYYLAATRRLDQAVAESKRGQELDPLSPDAARSAGWMLYFARRYDEAIEQYRKALELDPHFLFARWFLGITYVQKSMFGEAIAEFREAIALSGRSPAIVGSLARTYAASGHADSARVLLGELEKLSRKRYVTPAAFYNVYISLGQKDLAFEWLEKSFRDRSYAMVYLQVEPSLDPLRADPRFDSLLQRIGFPGR